MRNWKNDRYGFPFFIGESHENEWKMNGKCMENVWV